MIAEVQMTEEPAWGFREDTTGTYAIGKLDDPGAMRVVLTERELQVLELRQNIASTARDEMSKEQREYLLRQQLRAIQQELGDKDSDKAEV